MSNFWTKLMMCANRKAGKRDGSLVALPTRGVRLVSPLLLLFALLLGTSSAALGEDKFCSQYGGVIDGNVLVTSPVQVTIDTTCTFQNWPQSNPLTATINFQTNDPTIYLIIFDNVYYTGNMACSNIDHKLWFSNGSYYGSNNSCQELFIPIEKIDKQNPAGPTTASIGVPFTYTLTIPVMYDPATGMSSNFPSANDLGNIRVTDDLTATGAALTLQGINAYYKGSGTPVPVTNLGDNKHISFVLPDVLKGQQIVVEMTVVLDDTATNVAGTQFSNTAKWLFSRSIDVDEDGVIEPGEFYEPLPGEWGTTLPMTIAEPNLVVTKSSVATALNVSDTATFTIDVENIGGLDAWNATILDQLPAGMCSTDPSIALSAEIVAAGGIPVAGLISGTDYAVSYSGCQLSLTMLTARARIAPAQHLIITYQTQLDNIFTNDGAILTNVAGATQWFSASNNSGRTYSRTLTDGTPTVIDHQDSQTVTAALHGYYFEKTVENLTSQASPATSAVAGDRLRYKLRVFNVDQTIDSITISDPLNLNYFNPATFAMVTLSAGPTYTAIYSFNPTTGLLQISGNPTLNVAVQGELVIEFEITLKANLPGTTVSNQASLTAANGFTALSDDPYIDGVASPDVPGDENATLVAILTPGPLAKTNTQPSATIGEQFKYLVKVPANPIAVPLYDVRILDDLGPSAADLRFVSANVVSGGTWALTNSSGSATNLLIEDAVTGIDIPASGQAVIELTVELLNTTTNNRGLLFNNSAAYTYNRANGVDSTQTAGGAGSTVNMTVVEPVLTATKAVRFVTPAGKLITVPATVGDVLEYVLTLPNSGSSTAFASNVVDTLPANVALVPDSATAKINGVVVTGFVVNPATLPGGIVVWGRQNGDVSLDIPAGQSLVLTYQVTVVDTSLGAITNSVYVDWTSLGGASPAERTGAGCPTVDSLNDYCTGPARVTVSTINNTALAKAVIGDSYAEVPASTTVPIVRVGDTVTYELTLNLQEFTTRNVVLEDALPAGLAYASLVSITPTSGSSTFTYSVASQPAVGATGTLRWEFGDITNAPSNDNTPTDALVIRYVAQVVTAAPSLGVAYDPSVLRDNLAKLSYTGGPASLIATARVDVRQPQMRAITKIDLGSGRVGTGTLADPYQVNIASDVMNFRLSTCNDGLAPAYGVQISDVLANQLDESSITPPAVAIGGVALTAADYVYIPPAGRGGTMSFELNAPVNPGQCATIDYHIGFHADLTSQTSWSNQVQLSQYGSLPVDGRLYAAADIAQVWMTNRVGVHPLAKTLMSPLDRTIGEEVVYQIKVPAVPMNAALANVEVNDTLHPALVLVSASDGTNTLSNTSTVLGQVTLALGTIPAGEQAMITLIARVVNNDQANAGTRFTNTASYTYSDIPAGSLTSGSSAPLTIVEPSLTVTQSVNPATPPKAGDILTYTVKLAAAAGANFSSAFESTFVDTLSLGLAYLPGSTQVGGVAVEPAVSGDGVNTVQALTWASGIDISAGTSVTITYNVQVLATVVAGQTLTSSVTAQWTGRAGDNADERTGSGTPAYNDYVATAAAPALTIPIPTLTLEKIVTRLSGSTELPGELANPGDRLRYTIVIHNPSAIRVENFALTDELERLNATPRFQPNSLGSVVVPVGGVSSSNAGTLSVNGLEIGPNETLTLVFEATLKTDLKSGTIVLNQAELSGLWSAPLKSDDPNLPGAANPTKTVIPANGIVYDAETRKPLAGVTLTMRLAATGSDLPASCFIDPSQQNQVTPASGAYKFDLVFDATNCPDGADYLLAVTATPAGYVAEPSLLILPASSDKTAPYPVPVCAADAIPATDQCEAHASTTAPTGALTTYYLHLTLDATANQIFNNHIPVDPKVEEKISITKKSPLLNVSRGQLVPYTITVKNTLRSVLPALGIIDTLPAGFKYVEGSSRFDDTALEPVSNGRQLRWDNLTIGYKQPHTIKLLLVVGAGVAEGEYVNRAQVRNNDSGEPFSEEATATVRIIPDPTFDCTDVIGKVFDDRDLNGSQNAGEAGLAGIRVVTARGLIATSDEHGRFHITCAVVPDEDRGSNFILKLDDRSLPTGYRVTTENPRVERATRGKTLRYNFGATIHHVVSLDIADGVFEPDSTEMRIQWIPKVARLLEELKKSPSVLRLSYLAEVEPEALVRKRLDSLKKEIARRWELANGGYRLTVESEVFWRLGAPQEQ